MEHLPVSGRSTLGALIADERRRRGLSRAELAGLLRRADRALRTHEKTVRRWEAGDVPQPVALRALAAVLGRSVQELGELVIGRSAIEPAALTAYPAGEPADAAYVDAIHATMGHLVALELQHGGDDVAPLAARYFEAVRRRVAAGAWTPGVERDLVAAAGELAEVAGWLAHDADRQDAARRLNVEALHLSRLAGDRSVELLTMSNAAFIALFERQPGEALMIARAALADERLTGRQRVIFRLREARALAQLGDAAAAARAAQGAESAFYDGATSGDPEWSWWVDESEVVGHVAWAHIEAGRPELAVPILERAVDAVGPGHVNHRLFRLSRFLGALVEAEAWADTEEAIDRVLPYVAEVRSGRAVRLLGQSAEHLDRAPGPLREAGHHLRAVLASAGYAPA
jgi:transcriptional regulator with XRE-family HTH domain